MSSPTWMKAIQEGFGKGGIFTSRGIQQHVQSMTNWQRNQWLRAGSPRTMDRLEHFANLVHP